MPVGRNDALANGWLNPDSTVIEASSGSTAVSEAYFSRLLGVPFIAVMPASTSPEKIAAIEFQGGRCHLVDNPRDIHAQAELLVRTTGGHFMDQFAYAERATDWRANNNIAESIYKQMTQEPHSYYDKGWYEREGIDVEGADRVIAEAVDGGPLPPLATCGDLDM